MPTSKKLQIGWEEWIALPELKLPAIKAKIDTGARTSAIHAFMVEKIVEEGKLKVRFGIHPIPERPEIEIYCQAHLVDEREVTSSNGQIELRYVIRTMAQFGEKRWPIELTLTDRETMAYRMLIGRSAMEGRLLVVPGKSFLLGASSPAIYDQIAVKVRKRRLTVGIMSRDQHSYSTNRLACVIESRGHKIEIINTTRCYVEIGPKPNIHYQGHLLPRFDAIIPRIGPSITFYGVAILRQFESLGVFCLNSSSAIAHSRDRLFAHQLLGRAGIAMPATAFAHYPGDTKDMIKILKGAPLVIKLLEGPEGKGVVFAKTNKAAVAVMQAFRGLNADFIAQTYVGENTGKELQCVVLGNKVIAAIQIPRKEEDFQVKPQRIKERSVNITLAERKLATKAARVLGLKFAAVNLLRAKEGPLVINVNASPSLGKLEKVTGLDIATMVVKYIEAYARPRLPKRLIGYHI